MRRFWIDIVPLKISNKQQRDIRGKWNVERYIS